jgi:hypothetical protein
MMLAGSGQGGAEQNHFGAQGERDTRTG